MGKIWVEVCLISARGLRRTSSFWKLQWFAVGWIDSSNKYCSKIDASGNANPSWKTKFAALLDDSQFQDAALHVQVYSREPIFLREKLQGTATIVLKEFLAKHNKGTGASRPATEEFGSYQLRAENSSKTQGFIDISIRISEEKEELLSYPGMVSTSYLFILLCYHPMDPWNDALFLLAQAKMKELFSWIAAIT